MKKKKTVLITGSSTGIGRETAKLFQQNGWNVAATMRTPEKETELIQLSNVKCFFLDVTNNVSVDKTVQKIIEYFGDIDVLVNNAGVGSKGLFEAATLKDVKHQFDVNVFGVMNVMWAVLPHFRKREKGTVINISSLAGHIGAPINSFYCSTKFALEGLSESLFYELGTINVKIKLMELGPISSNFVASSIFFENPELEEYIKINNIVLPRTKKYLRVEESPSVVAKDIFEAATDETNKLRYFVGNGAELAFKQKQTIPFEIYSQTVKEKFGI